MPFPGYHSSTMPQLTSQRVIGAQGLQELQVGAPQQHFGAQVATHLGVQGSQTGVQQGEQLTGSQAAATGAGVAGAGSAASGSAGVGAASGAQPAGAQAAFAPQNPQLSFPQRFPTVQGPQGSHFGTQGSHFGAQHFGAQGSQELHVGAPQPHFGAQGSQQGEPNRQAKMPRFFPGYQSLLHTGFSYVQRGWNNGARQGLAQGSQPTLLQQQELTGLPQFEQDGC